MRILKVTQSYAPFFEFGGPPEKVRTLAEGLAHKGHEVTVLTADWGLEKRLKTMPNERPSEAGPFGRRRKVNGVTAIYLPSWLHYRALSWNPALGRYLRAKLKEFEVVHIFGLYDLLGPRVAAECRKEKIPYVVEPIGMFVPIVRNIRLKKMYHRIWGREMLAGADAIIATAEQERAELVAGGLSRERIALRRNGVEAPSKLPECGEFRRSLKIRPEEKLILFLGRLSQKKSPDLLLKAFAGLQREAGGESAGLHLVFVGPDESGMKGKLEQMRRQLCVVEQVHFCGPLGGEAKWAAYRDANIFVLPSQNENFGNTAAEAAAAGTPVVVTDQCGIAPLLKDVAGLVVRHEEGELGRALSRLLKNEELYRKLKEGCAGVVANLGWEEPVQEMEVIYWRLAARLRS
jgi:glycosyltransferase involved in cell wall biosynthesis